MKEIHIDMVLNVPDTVTAEDLQDQFVRWMESKDYTGGGGFRDITNDPYPDDEAKTLALLFMDWDEARPGDSKFVDIGEGERYDYWYKNIYLTPKT